MDSGKRKILYAVFSVVFVFCLALASITYAASAEESAAPQAVTLTMDETASIRSGAADGHYGIMFSVRTDKSLYDGIAESVGEEDGRIYQSAYIGMIIAPSDWVDYDDGEGGDYGITADNLFGTSAKYYFVCGEERIGDGYVELGGKEVPFGSASVIYDGEQAVFRLAIADIQTKNLAEEFVAVGYARLIAADGTETVIFSGNRAARSATYVAQLALDSGNAEDEEWIIENYIDAAAETDTSYNTEYRFADTKLNPVVKENVTGKISRTYSVPEFEGYVFDSDNPENVIPEQIYANDKTPDVIICYDRIGTPISTAEDLEILKTATDGYYYLTNDITYTSTAWTKGSVRFSGVLDGNGYKLTIKLQDGNALFNQFNGTVKNLYMVANPARQGTIAYFAITGATLDNVFIWLSDWGGATYAGAVFYENNNQRVYLNDVFVKVSTNRTSSGYGFINGYTQTRSSVICNNAFYVTNNLNPTGLRANYINDAESTWNVLSGTYKTFAAIGDITEEDGNGMSAFIKECYESRLS